MNRVSERSRKDSNAKFLFAARRMFNEIKYTKIFLYLLNVVPVVFCFLPSSDKNVKLICSCVSFGLTIINEIIGGLLSSYKEKAIMEFQLHEAEITGSTFSKIEYDRESTNDLQEFAIRKGLSKVKKKDEEGRVVEVPSEITDDYSYLYLCRLSAAKTRFLLSRLFVGYILLLIGIAIAIITATFKMFASESLYIFICFWPLIIPLIRNALSCKKCIRYCVKLSADIDNFFADGDSSVERLARFYYYVQNIEFEMMLARPIIFNLCHLLFRHGVRVLTLGVTQRFEESIVELKSRNMVMHGIISQPSGKKLITKKEYDMEELARIKKIKEAKASGKPVILKPAPKKPATTVTTAATPAKPAAATAKTATTTATPAKPATTAAAKPVATAKPVAATKPAATAAKTATTAAPAKPATATKPAAKSAPAKSEPAATPAKASKPAQVSDTTKIKKK